MTHPAGADRSKNALIDAFDYVFARLDKRLEGLSDAEYLWEPVGDCMTIRAGARGYSLDPRLPPTDSVPRFTTIAWRLCHIGGEVLLGFTGAVRTGAPSDFQQMSWPASANDGVGFVRHAYAEWRGQLEGMSAELFWSKLGPRWGAFGDDTYAALILHVFDEFVHHGAEVGVLRDLYHHQRASSGRQ